VRARNSPVAANKRASKPLGRPHQFHRVSRTLGVAARAVIESFAVCTHTYAHRAPNGRDKSAVLFSPNLYFSPSRSRVRFFAQFTLLLLHTHRPVGLRNGGPSNRCQSIRVSILSINALGPYNSSYMYLPGGIENI